MVDYREQVASSVMAAVEKNSGKGWFGTNKDKIREAVVSAIPADLVSPPESSAPVATGAEEPDLEKQALQAQLSETLEAHQVLNTEYQTAHKTLLDLGVLVTGSLEELKELAPLTTEKLGELIGTALKEKAQPVYTGDDSLALAWAENLKKNLTMMGHGPLASGRFEGAMDTLVQLENYLKAHVS